MESVAGKSVLFVMAVDAEYGPHLRRLFTPFMTGVGPVEAGVALSAELSRLKAENTLPDLVVSLGSAGSRTLEQTEIYQAVSVSYRDMDASALGFEKGATPFLNLDFVSYPYSHSLLGMCVGGLLLAAVWYWLCRARTVRGAVVVFLLVVSHWALDWVTHRPDLPLGLNGPHYGLGLWSNAPLTIAVEASLFVLGLWSYLRSTRPVSRAGTWGLWSLVVLLLLIYAGTAFGPPPPGWEPVAWAGLLSWLFPLWAWRIDVGRRRM